MMSPPRACMRAMPWVTFRVCPLTWLCQAVRAPGANRTRPTTIRWSSYCGLAMTSNQTSPVNCSGGFFTVDGFGWMWMVLSCRWWWSALAVTVGVLSSPSRGLAVGLSLSLGGVAAVDGKGDADDETCSRAAQPQHGCGDLLSLSEAGDRCRGGGFGAVELAIGDHVGDHRGLDGAWADGVDPDAAGGELQGGAGGQPDHVVFGGVVGGPAGEADQPTEGGAVHDGAAALGAHLGQLVLHAGLHPAQVDRVDTVEDLGRFVGGLAGGNLDAGVVERHVEPSERGDGAVHHGGHAVLVGDVAGDAQHLVAIGEGAGGGQTHTRARTRDEGYLPGEVVGRVHDVDLLLVVGIVVHSSNDVDQARSILAWKVSPWRSIWSIEVSNCPMRTMPLK